ncbi:MAG: hypothetical protein H6713_02705 [Myxococcales bacterium]|nr:hypothetical protein [Myxococcales bacterium]
MGSSRTAGLALLFVLACGPVEEGGGETNAATSTTDPSTTSSPTSAGPSSGSTTTGSGSSDASSPTGGETGASASTTTVTATTSGALTSTTDALTTTDASTTTTTQGGGGECVQTECKGKLYACGDCQDNDDDGLVDQADPECIGPCDDDESSFATGLPGDNMDACKQDCFFDGNSGAGDDKCEWNLKCDPENPGGDDCPYDPDFSNCPEMQNEQCVMNCQVPNGCDCFGCCSVESDGMTYDIYLGDPDCSLAMIEQCQPCTKNDDCDDDCVPELCELCFGQDPDDLPPECDGAECDEGKQSCTVDNEGVDDCPEGYFCFVGCCEVIIE